MQAVIDGFIGQPLRICLVITKALHDALHLPPVNNYNRAVIIATLNALCRKLGKVANTVHCKDAQPGECSQKLIETISSEYGKPRIAVIGLQPAMVEKLAQHFEIRVFDLDPENIGQEKYGVTIENGECDLSAVEKWCDLFLATGSKWGIDPFKVKKKPILFRTTVALGKLYL